MSNGNDRTKRSVEAQKRIARFAQMMESRNYFEILSVTRDAPVEAIRDSCRALAKQWHADAYAGLDLGSTKSMLDAIFARIMEAGSTLTDAKKRSEYLVFLDRQSKGLSTDVNKVLEAERWFDEGLIQLRRKDYTSAKSAFETARQNNPEDQLLLVHLAWVTYLLDASGKEGGRRALAILKEVVQNQNNIALAHQYMGEIFYRRSEFPEAEKCWKSCLQLEPGNIVANRGLRLLNARKEKRSLGLGKVFDRLFGKR